MKTAIPSRTYHLSNVLELKSYMKIVIDEAVETNENGDYLINIGYLRVSTDKQADQGYGLEIQEENVVRYCKASGYSNLVLFIDDGYTGTNMDRPALKAIETMIEHYNSGKTHIRVQAMIVPRFDRLGRTLLGMLQFIQDYIVAQKDSKNSRINKNKHTIQFVSVSENYYSVDSNNPQSTMMMGLFSTLAEYDRDLIVQKLKAGRRARVASGKWIGGGNVPYGYRYDKEKSALVVVPEEAEKVREIFRLYIEEQMPPQRIADRLGFKSDRVISQILRHKILAGYIVFNGEEFEGEHEPIISLETWQEAQDELKKRSSHRAASDYLLSGLIECGECGAKMRYQQWGKSRRCKIVCYSREKSKPNLIKDPNCDNERYWADEVEDAVIQELFRMTYLGDEKLQKQKAVISAEDAIEEQLRVAKKKLSRLYDLEDDDDDDILKEKIQNLRQQIRSLEKQMESIEEQAKIRRKVGKAQAIFRTLEGAWARMTDKEKQSVCRELIDRVVLYKGHKIDVHLKLQNYLLQNSSD